MNYAEKIRLVREKLIFTQPALAKEHGINVITVNRWGNGKSQPNFTAKKVIRELCVKTCFDIEKLQ
ncbi:MAG: XRE family transcriptional regulator [Christensenellaceae bacterium]|jgi:DNA-binding transcriptional regulator YiaG|nr:XRE family transcriptional regulator [Christensenellaceae bacterium]